MPHKYHDCGGCFATLIEIFNHPSALVINGYIKKANPRFAALCGRPQNEIEGLRTGQIFPGIDIDTLIVESLLRKKVLWIEREMEVDKRSAILCLRSAPIETQVGGVAFFTAIDTSAQRLMQLSMLRQMRKTSFDNAWIIDEDFKAVYMDVDDDSLVKGMHAGFDVMMLVASVSHDDARRAFAAARLEKCPPKFGQV